MIELKRAGKKKGRVQKGSALNQQSFGNCESWNFIVGKKCGGHRQKIRTMGELQAHNSQFMHSLFTK